MGQAKLMPRTPMPQGESDDDMGVPPLFNIAPGDEGLFNGELEKGLPVEEDVSSGWVALLLLELAY